jgi:four helix bundle protein
MTNLRLLPHHRLHVYGASQRLLEAVVESRIRCVNMRRQALRAAQGVTIQIAEGAGRVTRADKAHHYAIARGSAIEVAACVETALLCRDVSADAAHRVLACVDPVVAMLTRLVRP